MDIIQLQQAPGSAGNGTPGGSGNAVVPGDAPIQPPQAFVDNIGAFAFYPEEHFNNFLDLADRGITFVSPTLLGGWARIAHDYFDNPTISLSGNALSADNVNGILAALVTRGVDGEQINLSGGTNAAPTGQGLVDLQTLRHNGWTVTVNP